MPNPGYASMSVRTNVVMQVKELAIDLSALNRKRFSISDALLIAVQSARKEMTADEELSK
jgi:hypothetical protein